MCKVQGKYFVYLCTFAACLASFLMGYDVGIMSGAIIYMEKDIALTTWDAEIIISSLSFFSVIGALMSGQIASSHGRKRPIVVCAILFFLGSIVMVITENIGVIIFGRVLLGISTGFATLIATLYSAELAPSSMRGKLVAVAELSINIGILFGYFISWIFYFVDDDTKWRFMISFGCIPATILFFSILILPESPRWLVENGAESRAREILLIITDGDNGAVESEIKEIQQSILMEKKEIKSNWNEILLPCIYKPPLPLQKALIIGCGVAFFQQATGVDAIVYYTPITLRSLGLNEEKILLYTTYIGVFKLFFVFVAMMLLDKIGRRRLLLLSSILIGLALFLLSISFIADLYVGFIVILQCFYVSAFSIGAGPVCWVMVSEIYPLKIRSKGMALSTSINRIVAGFVALFFLSIQNLVSSSGIWVGFTIISIVNIVFVYYYVPETKNKSLEEITASLVFSDPGDTNEHSESSDELTPLTVN